MPLARGDFNVVTGPSGIRNKESNRLFLLYGRSMIRNTAEKLCMATNIYLVIVVNAIQRAGTEEYHSFLNILDSRECVGDSDFKSAAAELLDSLESRYVLYTKELTDLRTIRRRIMDQDLGTKLECEPNCDGKHITQISNVEF